MIKLKNTKELLSQHPSPAIYLLVRQISRGVRDSCGCGSCITTAAATTNSGFQKDDDDLPNVAGKRTLGILTVVPKNQSGTQAKSTGSGAELWPSVLTIGNEDHHPFPCSWLSSMPAAALADGERLRVSPRMEEQFL